MRVLSLFTPSGHPTLGNLLGAFLPAARLLPTADCVFGVSDLHALTSEHDPARLREQSLELAGLAVAAGGLDGPQQVALGRLGGKAQDEQALGPARVSQHPGVLFGA